MIERTFIDINEDKIEQADRWEFLTGWSRSQGVTWNDLLKSQRILIVSEAGAGKTYECKKQAKLLWNSGEPAFFIDLSSLMHSKDIRELFNYEEEKRFDDWLMANTGIATFFLDSIDELEFNLRSFEQALKKFDRYIKHKLDRVKIIVTTRPIPFDKKLVDKILPIPVSQPTPNCELSADIAQDQYFVQKKADNSHQNQQDRTVALMPLSDKQIVEFSRGQGVKEADRLLEDIIRRDAREFARRPQELIELCADWLENKRIRTHKEQVETSIRVKLLPSGGRKERAQLEHNKAEEGAQQLALAVQLTRCLTIRHSAASDNGYSTKALDARKILTGWTAEEQEALLERPLFGFSSYGRVRFNHRSITEYLAAKELIKLRQKGMSLNELKRVLCEKFNGKFVLRPSKKAIAGWLAILEKEIHETAIFNWLLANEPDVLLNEGDPQSLTSEQRIKAIHAYICRYRDGGRRRRNVLDVSNMPIFRFASPDLADEIKNEWQKGIENPEIREFLLKLISAGNIKKCADIVYQVALNKKLEDRERILAVQALYLLDDDRFLEIVSSMSRNDKIWTENIIQQIIPILVEKTNLIVSLITILQWLSIDDNVIFNIKWYIKNLKINNSDDIEKLEKLRDGLLKLVATDLKGEEQWPFFKGRNLHLAKILVAVCERGLDINHSDEWLYASIVALNLSLTDQHHDIIDGSFREQLDKLNANDMEKLFWLQDKFFQSYHKTKDPWERLNQIAGYDKPVQLRLDRDLPWITKNFADKKRNLSDRLLLLNAALDICPSYEIKLQTLEKLKQKVLNEPSIIKELDEYATSIRNAKNSYEKKILERKKKEEQKQNEQLNKKKYLFEEINKNIDDVFSDGLYSGKLANLFDVFRNQHNGNRSGIVDWDRGFLKQYFSDEVIDRLRLKLMSFWRKNRPPLASERPDKEQLTWGEDWLLGLVGLYAEAEDKQWATKLSSNEAELAMRYALINLDGFHDGLNALLAAHQNSVKKIFKNELMWVLDNTSIPMCCISLFSELNRATKEFAQFFIPCLETWLNKLEDIKADPQQITEMVEKVNQITQIILKHGDVSNISNLQQQAVKRLSLAMPCELDVCWLSVLMRCNPERGVENLEQKLQTFKPDENSKAIIFFRQFSRSGYNPINLARSSFTPKVLLRLAHLARLYIQPKDDVYHNGGYTPDARDEAQEGRAEILSALMNQRGDEGYAAKLQLAGDPLFSDISDWIKARADEMRAEEIDCECYKEEDVVTLRSKFEAPIATNGMMFQVLEDRLSDLDELLLQDTSPRERWAAVKDEKMMRREIAHALDEKSAGIYTTLQEAVTGDEKETDIRLRSSSPKKIEAVIELKLGDHRTAKDLRDTIEKQLVEKYLAPENRRSGALVVIITKDRTWQHPDDGHSIDTKELLMLLKEEAKRVEDARGNTVFLTVHILDLRPRLALEKNAKKQNSEKASAKYS